VLHAQLFAVLLQPCCDSWHGWGDRSMLLCYIHGVLWAGCDSLVGHDVARQVQLSCQHRGTREKAAAKVQVACLRSPAAEQKINKHQIRDLNRQHYLLGWKGVRPQSKSALQNNCGTGSSKESRWQVSGHLTVWCLPKEQPHCPELQLYILVYHMGRVNHYSSGCEVFVPNIWQQWQGWCLLPVNLFWTHANVIVCWLYIQSCWPCCIFCSALWTIDQVLAAAIRKKVQAGSVIYADDMPAPQVASVIGENQVAGVCTIVFIIWCLMVHDAYVHPSADKTCCSFTMLH